MKKITKISAVVITTSVLGMASLAAFAGWGEHDGNGEGYGGHQGQMMGSNMESHMRGQMGGKMGGHMGGTDRALDLSADEVRTLIEARMIMRGNDRLKVGKITQKDDQTYLVDIVTVDDSLVRQIEVDKNNGPGHGMKRFDK